MQTNMHVSPLSSVEETRQLQAIGVCVVVRLRLIKDHYNAFWCVSVCVLAYAC